MPESLPARRQMAMDLYMSGLLGEQADPTTKRRVLKMMEMGHVWDIIADDLTLEEKIIEAMNEMMAGQGGQPGGLGALVQGLRQNAGPVPGPPQAGGQPQGAEIPAMGPVAAGF